MCKDLHHEQRSIMLPASVLDALKDMTAGALKVFIHLCSCNQGQPFAASIPTIKDATGIQPRSVISALNTLLEHQLITRIQGSGNQPNQYGIPFPALHENSEKWAIGGDFSVLPSWDFRRLASDAEPTFWTSSKTAKLPSLRGQNLGIYVTAARMDGCVAVDSTGLECVSASCGCTLFALWSIQVEHDWACGGKPVDPPGCSKLDVWKAANPAISDWRR